MEMLGRLLCGLAAVLLMSSAVRAQATGGACTSTWASSTNTAVGGGQTQPATVNTVALCQAACTSTAGCTGFDWNGVNTCWLSGSWSGTWYNGTANGLTHYVLTPASGNCGVCSPTWTTLASTSIGGGQTQASTVNTVALCQAACITTTGCNGFDWNAATTTCWLSGTWSTTWYNGTATGITHYTLIPASSNCGGSVTSRV